MKKTIVLMTIVLAILAAPVFAEVTASGEVNFMFGYNGEEPGYAETTDANEVEVDLGGTVGEYTSIAATLSAEAGYTGDGAVGLDAMVLTQDVTGALGVDAGVTFALSMGMDSFGPEEYQAVAGYGDFEYEYELDPGTIMTKYSIGLADMLTVDVARYELGTELNDDAQTGINAYGTFGMVSASVSYLMTEGDDVFGFNVAADPMAGLSVGAGMETYLYDDNDWDYTTKYGVSAAYTMDALTAGLAFKSAASDMDDAPDFAEVSYVTVSATYAVTDMLNATAAYGTVLDKGDAEQNEVQYYEVGADYTLDGVTYAVGYTHNSDFSGYDADLNNEDGETVGNVYIKVSASF